MVVDCHLCGADHGCEAVVLRLRAFIYSILGKTKSTDIRIMKDSSAVCICIDTLVGPDGAAHQLAGPGSCFLWQKGWSWKELRGGK
jgi:thiazole synthase ThiGH ThiG subunit